MESSSSRETIRHLQEAVRLNPQRARYAGLLGEALVLGGEIDAAIPHLFHASRNDPSPHHLQFLALALLAKGRWAEAETTLSALIAEAPLVHRAWYLRARARSRLRRDGEALDDLREALSMEDSREYRLAVARVLLEAPRPLDHHALQWGGRILREIDVNDAESAFLKAGLLLLRERRAEATPLLQRIVGVAPWQELAEELVTSQAAIPELPWPDVLDTRAGLIPAPPRIGCLGAMPSKLRLERLPLDEEEPATTTAGSTKSRLLIADLLQEGRRLLDHDPEQATRRLGDAYRLVKESGDDSRDTGIQRLRAGICEALASASGTAGPSREELYHGGARSPGFLRSLAWELLDGGRRDLVALEVFVSALECRALDDQPLRQRLLKALAQSLKVTLGSSLGCVLPRVPLLERLHALEESVAFPALYLGLVHYLGRDFGAAGELFAEVPQGASDTPRLLFLRGRCAEKLGHWDEALDLYRRSLGASPAQCHAHFRVGRILLARQRSA